MATSKGVDFSRGRDLMENAQSAGQVALLGPDSLPHDGVPKGEVRGPFVLPSQAYPGYHRMI
jgi:hypothetical protein